MNGSRIAASSSEVSLDATVTSALQHVRSDALAVMLYGSRARHTARPDSDIDILAVVRDKPGSIDLNNVSISYYTPDHLFHLASEGSLFTLHLRTEGLTISDPDRLLRRILDSYTPRSDYNSLRAELRSVLDALAATDRHKYETGLRRAGLWAARSAVYLACAEQGDLSFDADTACAKASVPELAGLLRQKLDADLDTLRVLGLRALGVDSISYPNNLATLALQLWNLHPGAAKVLESVISGASRLEYTQLTLPLV